MLRNVSDERLEDAQAVLRGRLGLVGDVPKAEDVERRIANLLTVKLLEAHSTLEFRGRTYKIPPLPFTLGCDLQRARLKLAELNKFGPSITLVGEYEQMLHEAVDVMWRAMRPKGWRAAVRRRLGLEKNPLNGASEAEVGYLLGFFSTHQTQISVPGESHRQN